MSSQLLPPVALYKSISFSHLQMEYLAGRCSRRLGMACHNGGHRNRTFFVAVLYAVGATRRATHAAVTIPAPTLCMFVTRLSVFEQAAIATPVAAASDCRRRTLVVFDPPIATGIDPPHIQNFLAYPHNRLRQSRSSKHACSRPQAAHSSPPQSTSVSMPFLTPSLHRTSAPISLSTLHAQPNIKTHPASKRSLAL